MFKKQAAKGIVYSGFNIANVLGQEVNLSPINQGVNQNKSAFNQNLYKSNRVKKF